MRGPGKKIGVANLKAEEKWRCATCKMANDNSLDACGRCHDPKRILIEKKLATGGVRSNSGPVVNSSAVKHPPMRFTNKKVPKNKAVALENQCQQAAAAVVNKNKN